MPDLARPELVKPLLVFLGSGAGGVIRYGVDAFVVSRWTSPFPVGILLVNVTGCFLMGVLSTTLVRQDLRLLVLVGLLGGYTTFSAFSRDTLTLAQEGRWGLSAANVVLSVLLSVGACWLGMALGGSHAEV